MPFSERVRWTATGSGDEADQARLLGQGAEFARRRRHRFLYLRGTALARDEAAHLETGQHLPAIVIMTDGKSQGEPCPTFEAAWRAEGRKRAGVRRHLR